jgi:hypothetical protein
VQETRKGGQSSGAAVVDYKAEKEGRMQSARNISNEVIDGINAEQRQI